MREIVSEEDAVAERFPGSPTIRVDGADLFPIDEPPSLTCRIYRAAPTAASPPRRTRASCASGWRRALRETGSLDHGG